MKECGIVKRALNECQLSREQNELWDGEPDMFINQGWIEALEYVLDIRKEKKYFQYVSFDKIKEKLYEESYRNKEGRKT